MNFVEPIRDRKKIAQIKNQLRGQRRYRDLLLFTEAYQKAMRKRGVWVEPLFGEAKEFHRLRRFRLRGLMKVHIEGIMIAAGQNLKRLIKYRLGRLYSLVYELLFQLISTGDFTFSTA